jgi:predicted nucleotidyltransferase
MGIRSFGVKRLGLFGSFARNTGFHSESDVDLLVEFESGKKSYDNFIDLALYLEELLARKVELVTPQSLAHIAVRSAEKPVKAGFYFFGVPVCVLQIFFW